jgi:hypothetical protein
MSLDCQQGCGRYSALYGRHMPAFQYLAGCSTSGRSHKHAN